MHKRFRYVARRDKKSEKENEPTDLLNELKFG